MTEEELEDEIKKEFKTNDVEVGKGEDGSIVAILVRNNFSSSDLEKLESIAKKHNLSLEFFVSAYNWYWIMIECRFRR
jgi:hypothetical protein